MRAPQLAFKERRLRLLGLPKTRVAKPARARLPARPLITGLLIATFLVAPAAARASLVDEQRQGQQLIEQLQAGTTTCRDLSAEDFDHVGEYVMYRALGSTSLHQAMNERMTLMMGEHGETRMHQLLGRRYTGCYGGVGGAEAIGSIGPGMMGGGYYGGWGAMMGSGDWSWMMGGAWQRMTRQDWQRLEQRLLGSSPTSGDWSPVAIVAATLGGVLVIAVAILGLNRRPFRRPPQAAASH